MNLDATVTISMPANSSYKDSTFIVPAGQTKIYILATSFADFAKVYANTAASGSTAITGQTNRGILITSDNDITVYYDYDNYYNRDLFSLKGSNALGTDFYVPFQIISSWGVDSYNPDAKASVEIVATEDNTTITITPTIKFEGRTDANPFTITLNRGQTYTLTSPTNTTRGVGTRVQSDKKIAVTTNDDSVRGAANSCYDIIGDQLVPTNVIGSKYIVMPGKSASTATVPTTTYKNDIVGDQIFVVATQPNTTISFYGTDGTFFKSTTLNAGKSDYFSIDISQTNMNSIYVTSNDESKPFYILHTTGIGCELGGAILPPITNCTGSSQVSFYRSTTINDITVNLMIPYDPTISFTDIKQSHYHFTLLTYDASGNVASTYAIPGTWFEPNQKAGWAVLKMANRNFNSITTKGVAHKVINTEDFFHLGMTNGTSGQTGKYGYFSSFNAAKAEVYIPQSQENSYIACYGTSLNLVATGGLDYTWHYGLPNGSPKYLSDSKSSTPKVEGLPVGNHIFYVEVKQSKCFGTDTLKAIVTILPVVNAAFEVDKNYICSPDTLHVINKSENGNVYTWRKQINSGKAFDMSFTAPNNEMKFSEYLNDPSTTAPQYIKYTLIAESTEGCADVDSITIPVYPRIKASFTPDTTGCHPLPVQFKNYSAGNADTYEWKFGDQGSSVELNPFHSYNNFTSKDTTYNVELVAKSPFYCTDTARSTVTVHPYIYAHYAVDTVKGCSPLQIKIQNGSLGAISRYKWEYGNADTSNRSDANYTYTYTNKGSMDSTRRLRLSVFNTAGCLDSISRLITAYPEISTRFSVNADTGCTPLPVTFTNLSNAAADSFYWNFGDGNSSYLKNPFHEYQNQSTRDTTFKVKLMATTSEHCPGYDSTYVLIRGFIDPRFSIDTSQYCAPFTITVKNNSIHASSAILSWNFGDSPLDTVTSGANIVHLYRNQTPIPFNLNVRLNLIGSGGCSKTLSKPVTIFPEIKADFIPDTAGCNPLPVKFRNLSTNMVAQSFLWNFSDSASSVEKNPFHTFSHLKSTDQIYPVKLLAQSAYHCKDSITKNITVYSYIDARFSIDRGFGCSPLNIAITDSSSGGITSKLWNTGGTPIVNNKIEYLNNTDSVVVKNMTLTVINSHACRKTFTRPVTIYPKVNAQYIVQPDTIGCNPFPIDFEHNWAYRNIISKYRWEFGDYASSSDRYNTSHTFKNNLSTIQPYKTKLVVQSAYNCTDSAEKTIYVYPYIKANFGIDTARGCSPLTINIDNASSDGANTFTWRYDDGTPWEYTSAKVHYHTYNNTTSNPLTFNPQLTASYNGLCENSVTQNVEVYPVVKASFTEDTLKGCHPLEITYTNQSANANRYNWYFGDKGTSIQADPVHTYANFSNVDSFYTVTLLSTSEFNCSNRLSKTVTVYPKPKAIFSVDNSINCPPFYIPIDNFSQAGDTFFWTYGDNQDSTTTSLGRITHPYYNYTNNIKDYDLNLFVKTVHNCTDNVSQTINVYPKVFVDFTPYDTAGCSPVLVPFVNKSNQVAEKFIWDFGDNSSSKIKSPTHQFFNSSVNDTTFNINLIGISKFDCRDTSSYRQVTVYPQPVARFIALPSHMEFPLSTVDISNETNAGFWDFLWDFGDTNTSIVRDPKNHTYNHWGDYTIILKASSSNCTNSTEQLVRIFPPKPIAGFFASQNGCVPLDIHFTDTSKYANSWKWEFDDGGTSTEQNPDHTYLNSGKYNVKLTITGDGGTDYTYQVVYVYPKPVVDFTQNPTLVMLPDSSRSNENSNRGWVQFTNLSKYGTKFSWDFGDGTNSKAENPQHRYTQVGIYDVTLNVWTQNECFDSIVHRQIIKVIVRKDIIFPNAFTPNISGSNGGAYNLSDINNDVFHPTWAGIVEFHMEIYDRWGEKLFESNDINIGWDGYYKGKLCKSDVYVCKASGRYADGSDFNYFGDVTLIR
jgi:gliding motility-associated-like protein